MSIDEKALQSAWKELKKYLFIQDAEIETRPIRNTEMLKLLERAIEAYESAKVLEQPDECRAAFDKHYRPCLGSPDDVALDRGNAWHNFNAGWNARPIMRESSEVVSVEKIARMGINVSWEELPEDVRKQKLAYARDVIAAAGFIPVMPISLDKCVASYQASPHSASGNYSMRGCVIAVLEAAGVKYE